MKKIFLRAFSELLRYRTPLVSCFSRLQSMIKCDDLRDLVPFVQFKKREKYAWGRVTFGGKVAGLSLQLY